MQEQGYFPSPAHQLSISKEGLLCWLPISRDRLGALFAVCFASKCDSGFCVSSHTSVTSSSFVSIPVTLGQIKERAIRGLCWLCVLLLVASEAKLLCTRRTTRLIFALSEQIKGLVKSCASFSGIAEVSDEAARFSRALVQISL